MPRDTVTARLVQKYCLSGPDQCYDLLLSVGDHQPFPFEPGQFISAVTEDPHGKQQTRAYSLASAAHENLLELCVNRVQDGFFSNHLADLADLPLGASIQIHGPYGNFTLRQPVTDAIFVGAGAGIAPLRAFTHWLFPWEGLDRSEGKVVWLVQGARHESELYFNAEFEQLARRFPNFRYQPTLIEPRGDWYGPVGPIHEQVARIVEQRAARLGQSLPLAPLDPALPPAAQSFDFYAYVSGLNSMVSSVRETLTALGLHRKQIVFERYD